jgi:hypothetical protein
MIITNLHIFTALVPEWVPEFQNFKIESQARGGF